jgi:hypothetical protein
MKAPGRIYLLITGILYIIFGSLFLLLSVFLWLLDFSNILELTSNLLNPLISSFFYLIIGSLGIIYRNNPVKAHVQICLGVVNIIFLAAPLFSSNFYPSPYAFVIILRIMFLIVPIFYIIGVCKNKNFIHRAKRDNYLGQHELDPLSYSDDDWQKGFDEIKKDAEQARIDRGFKSDKFN